MTQLRLFDLPQTEYTSDDYWTPKWIFDALKVTFDLDVASPPQGPAHTPCRAYFTQQDDGLSQDWHGNVWMNPPFSKTSPWIQRFMQHNNGICLVPMAKTKWFNKLWNTADAILALPNDLKFDQGGIFIATVLAAYGEQNVQALHQSNIGRVR